MGRRDELIGKYADDLRKLGIEPDMALLENATAACGPAIYREDASTVASSDPEEMARVRENFCKKKLGATDEATIDAALAKAVETYGSANRNKHRAVMYYLLARELGGL